MPTVEARTHYSVSQLNLFAKCPMLYYKKYVLGQEEQPSYNLVCGSSGHAALEVDNNELIDKGTGLDHAGLLEIATEEFKTRREQLVKVERDLDKFVKDVGRPFEAYARKRPVPEIPESAEKRYEVELFGRPFVSIVDVEYSDTLADYKFLSRKKSARDVDLDPQLYIYKHLTGKSPMFIELIKGKDDLVVAKPDMTPNRKRFIDNWVHNTIDAIEHCKESGVWPQCGPTAWWCGPQCAFWFQCAGDE